jgi:hypothetical protein
MSLVDPTGRLVTEIRDDPAVAAYPCTRVRGGDPWPEQRNAAGVVTMTADAQGAGKYNRFILVRRLGRSRLKRCPSQEVRFVVKVCGLTEQDAAALAGVVSDSFHAKGHRISSSGVSIFGSFDDGDNGTLFDPDTRQPYVDLIAQVNASTALIT